MALLVPYLRLLASLHLPMPGSKNKILPMILLLSLLQILVRPQRSTPFMPILWTRLPKGKRREKARPKPMPRSQIPQNLVLMIAHSAKKNIHV